MIVALLLKAAFAKSIFLYENHLKLLGRSSDIYFTSINAILKFIYNNNSRLMNEIYIIPFNANGVAE